MIEKAFVLLTHLIKRASDEIVEDILGSKTFLRKFCKDSVSGRVSEDGIQLLKLLDDKMLLDAARERKPQSNQEEQPTGFDLELEKNNNQEEEEEEATTEATEEVEKDNLLLSYDDWQMLPEEQQEEKKPQPQQAPAVDPSIQELLAMPSVPSPMKPGVGFGNFQGAQQQQMKENMVQMSRDVSSMKITELFDLPQQQPAALANSNHQGIATTAAMMHRMVVNNGNPANQQQQQYNNGWAW